MDHRRRVGQLRPRLVVVGHDHVDAQFAGHGHRLDAGDAAIDSDDQRGFARRQGADRLAAQAIAFFQPVRNIIADFRPQQFQAPPQEAVPVMPSTS